MHAAAHMDLDKPRSAARNRWRGGANRGTIPIIDDGVADRSLYQRSGVVVWSALASRVNFVGPALPLLGRVRLPG